MYTQRITTEHPLAVIFMVDQSGSMAEKIVYQSALTTKAELVSILLNKALSEMIYRSRVHDDIKDYFRIAILGYSEDSATSLLPYANPLAKTSQIYSSDCKKIKLSRKVALPNGSSKVITTYESQWITPLCKGETPMGDCIVRAIKVAKSHIKSYPDSFPPLVINISDGEQSDCSDERLKELAEKLRSLQTSDGNLIFMNLHIAGSGKEQVQKSIFPNSENQIPQLKHAQTLYEISSQMPDVFNAYISSELKHKHTPPYKAMSYNCSINDFFAMINIGSTTLTLQNTL